MTTPRERVLTTLKHQEPDRVPLGFDANEGLLQKLLDHYGVDNRMDLYGKMGIDGFSVFTESYVPPKYIGPEPPTADDGSKADFFGIVSQKRFPLAYAEQPSDLDDYRWPQADWFDYSTIRQRCLEVKKQGIVTVGGEGGTGVQHAINLRGYEKALIDPYTNPDLAHAYMERMGDFFVAWNEAWIGAGEGEFDVFRCGDDMGNSLAMHCSPDTWREYYKPQLARSWAVAKKHGLKIWFHCCGCCRPVLEDLIEIGVDMWDPVPGYVKGNNQKELKQKYGDQISFVGGVDLPNVLVKGTVQDVADETKRVIDIFAPGGGFILCGSQVLTNDVPVENAIAMYETALEYGVY